MNKEIISMVERVIKNPELLDTNNENYPEIEAALGAAVIALMKLVADSGYTIALSKKEPRRSHPGQGVDKQRPDLW